MSILQPVELINQGNTLRTKFTSAWCSNNMATSPELVISGLVVFQVKSLCFQMNSNNTYYNRLTFLIKLNKVFETDNLVYAIKMSSDVLGVKDSVMLTDDTDWRQVYEGLYMTQEVDITLKLDISSHNTGLLARLHTDLEMTDFELRGKDGSVGVHKSVLAGYSPVISTMLSGQWREVDAGAVEVPNTTKVTLQHLKDYMYLQKLPEDGLEQLAMLASYYMMSDLKDRCAVKLLSNLTADNAPVLLEFALRYKLDKLMLAILENVRRENIQIKDIEKKCHELSMEPTGCK